MNKEKYEKPVIRKVELDEVSIVYTSAECPPDCPSDNSCPVNTN